VITLITPNFNGAEWLEECLDSVANQTIDQRSVEMIVIDDGSTDNSAEIVESYQSRIPGLKLVRHTHVGKPSYLRNLAIEMALGEYVLFLDSDDFLGPEALERLHVFVDNASSDVVAFQLEGLGRSVPRSMLRTTAWNVDVVTSGVYKTLGIWKMCRREFLVENDIRFPAELGRADDVIFFVEAMLKADIISVVAGHPFYTVRGRMDGSSITQKAWPHRNRTDFAVHTARTIEKWARNQVTADHFMIRVFNTEALEIITDPTATPEDLQYVNIVLRPFWTANVAKLVYTEENRTKLTDFFGEAR
jgi:poly(ribitol-phosphate) beta-N-acetylglucosaminyltransferase